LSSDECRACVAVQWTVTHARSYGSSQSQHYGRLSRGRYPAAARRYAGHRLPALHVNVLVTEDHPAHLAPLAQMLAGIGGAVEPVLAAYRSGGGVPYPMFGTAFRKGQASINRPAFASDLVDCWIPATVDIHRRLMSSPRRVADVGCGGGWSTIAMARARLGHHSVL
jgi:2-polyprenyl-3-methyl-5-hydroxy-6-metoxy-1,4-benzoquinol methylase